MIYPTKPSIQRENSPRILINTFVCRGQSFAYGKHHATAADLVACNERVLKSMRNKQLQFPPLHKLPAFHFQFLNLTDRSANVKLSYFNLPLLASKRKTLDRICWRAVLLRNGEFQTFNRHFLQHYRIVGFFSFSPYIYC